MKNISCENLTDIADKIIEEIQQIKDPFETPTIVFHNMKVAQWFKAYYLKTRDEVLMNVEFTTLSVFLNGLINPGEKYKIMDRGLFRDFILKALLNPGKYPYDNTGESEINYIYRNATELNGTNLYEFADKLASLFTQYELEEAEINGWEKTLYDETLALAKDEGCVTSKSLYEDQKELELPQGPVYIIDNSYTTPLFMDIIKACGDNVIFYQLSEDEKDTSVKAFSAPSKLREVEAVHSDIWQIVKDTKDIRFNDFVVYAPNLDEYISSIKRVFQQDDKEFPTLPFRIVGESQEKLDILQALDIVFDIANKRFFTRNDLYKFAKIPMVKWLKGIDDADIDAWMNTISKTNTHRNGKVSDDWDYLKKRMLLSLLVSNSSDLDDKASLGDTEYVPYSSIELDNDRMNILIDVIDQLNQWVSLFRDQLSKLKFSKDEQEQLVIALDSLLSKKGTDGEEKNYIYRKVREEAENLIGLDINIPVNTLFLCLQDTVNRVSINPPDMFVGGVTFINFKGDDIVAADYSYVLGMSSNNVPRIDVKSELDKTKEEDLKNHKSSKELDEISVRNICKNSKHVCFSFENIDLTKDEEFFPSPLIMKYLNVKKAEDIPKISLDETRTYAELFTKKEFKNKAYYDGISQESVAVKTSVPSAVPDANIEIKTSEIKKYLENSFIYKFNKLFGKAEDDNENLNEYEEIDENALTKYNIIKDMILNENGPEAEKEKIRLTKMLPEGELGELYLEQYTKTVEEIRDYINDGKYQLSSIDPLEISVSVPSGSNNQFRISSSQKMFRKREGTELSYIEPTEMTKAKDKHYLNMYIASLMDVASEIDSCDSKYSIKMGYGDKVKNYDITPSEAKEILTEICMDMTDYTDIKYMDLFLINKYKKPILEEDNGKGEFAEFEDISSTFVLSKIIANDIDNEHAGDWKYFEGKGLINPYTDFGYTESTFSEDFKDKVRKMGALIRFIEGDEE